MTSHTLRHKIQASFAAQLHKAGFPGVEVTLRGEGRNRESLWTLDGEDRAVRGAAAWLVTQGLLELGGVEPFQADQELGLTFAYLQSPV